MFAPPYKNCNTYHITQLFHDNHKAVDFAFMNCWGTILTAMDNCKIECIVDNLELSHTLDKFERGYGIKMRSQTTGLYILYWHCINFFPVDEGDYVKQGDYVALLGNSGNCFRNGVYVPLEDRHKMGKFGSHLHLEVFSEVNGNRQYFDPLNYIDFTKPVNTTIQSVLNGVKVSISKIQLAFKR
jgi:hypothetical protein